MWIFTFRCCNFRWCDLNIQKYNYRSVNEKTFWLPRSRPKSPYSTLPLSQRAPNAYKTKQKLSQTTRQQFWIFFPLRYWSIFTNIFPLLEIQFSIRNDSVQLHGKNVNFFSSIEIALGDFFSLPKRMDVARYVLFWYKLFGFDCWVDSWSQSREPSRRWMKQKAAQSSVDRRQWRRARDRLIRALSVFVWIDRKSRKTYYKEREKRWQSWDTCWREAVRAAIETIYWSFQSRRYHIKWLKCILVARSWRPLINSIFFDIEQIRHVKGTKDDDETFNEYFISAQKELSWISKEKKHVYTKSYNIHYSGK